MSCALKAGVLFIASGTYSQYSDLAAKHMKLLTLIVIFSSHVRVNDDYYKPSHFHGYDFRYFSGGKVPAAIDDSIIMQAHDRRQLTEWLYTCNCYA